MTDIDLKKKLDDANNILAEKPKKDENIHTMVIRMILIIISEILKRILLKPH